MFQILADSSGTLIHTDHEKQFYTTIHTPMLSFKIYPIFAFFQPLNQYEVTLLFQYLIPGLIGVMAGCSRSVLMVSDETIKYK